MHATSLFVSVGTWRNAWVSRVTTCYAGGKEGCAVDDEMAYARNKSTIFDGNRPTIDDPADGQSRFAQLA